VAFLEGSEWVALLDGSLKNAKFFLEKQ